MTPPAAPDSHILLERARRLAETNANGSALTDLEAGFPLPEISRRRGLPLARVLGTKTFYDALSTEFHSHSRTTCEGTACWSARSAPESADHRVHCLGRCYEAPVSHVGPLSPERHGVPAKTLADPPVIFRHLFGARPDLDQLYALPSAEIILARLEISGLRGRGGAAYPTAAKWRAARHADADVKYIVANGDEGDPGSYIDRLLLEAEPHDILAGMNACAKAIGNGRPVHGIVFIRGEYPYAATRMQDAISDAEPHLIPGFTLEVRVGAGSYVCGEETALLRAIEGLRAEASPKPPYPGERGLFGKPTVVQNVETLSIVPWVLETGLRPTTKAFSLSGAIPSPSAIEAPFGVTLAELLREAGGEMPGRPFSMALVGGPMGTIIPARHFDVELDPLSMPALGHGGIVVFDTRTTPRALAHHLFEFARHESCGACTPCRIGTRMLSDVQDEASLLRLLDTLDMGSLCGFGQGISRPLRDLLREFPGTIFDRSHT
jgi:NADH:ubiquinone oxidoreductase subunit F (NADH-binding)